jgi:outer membrane immunogenic protein
MKKVLLAVLCATSSLSFADSKVFEGLSIDASTGYQKTERDSASTATQTNSGVTTVSSFSSTSNDDSNINLILGSSYNYAINNDYLVGVGFDYDFLDHDMGSPILDNDPTNNSASFKLSEAMSFYLKPQLMITDKSQVYAKLGYIRAKVKLNDSDPGFTSSKKESVEGYSIGAGYAHMFGDNISLFVEANYLNYGKEDVGANYSQNPTFISLPTDVDAYNGKIGVAYKF